MKYENIAANGQVAVDTYSWKRWGMAAVAFLLSIAVLLGVQFAFGLENKNRLVLMLGHGLAAGALLLLAHLQFWKQGGVRSLIGHNIKGTLKVGVPLVVFVYVLELVMVTVLGYGREPFMVSLYDGLSPAGILLFLAMLLVFPPLSEELLYRHFLLRLFPLHRRFYQYFAVVLTAVLFMLLHQQYKYWTTFILIAVLALIFGAARIASGGLAAPVILHGVAEVAGVSVDFILSQLG